MGHHLGLEERPSFLCKFRPKHNVGSLRKEGKELMGKKSAVSVTEDPCPRLCQVHDSAAPGLTGDTEISAKTKSPMLRVQTP